MFLRSHLTQNWTKYIDQVVEGLNSIPLKRLGYLTPNSIKSEKDSVRVYENLKKYEIPTKKEPTFTQQDENQKKYLKNTESNSSLLKVGDYVYLNFLPDAFSKSFDTQERNIFQH